MTDDFGDAVAISIPAKAEHVAVLRAATGVVAARLEFSIDDIDDLRILVDEAASVLLAAGAEGHLHCQVAANGDSVRLRISGTLPGAEVPHDEGFAWNILRALAHEVSSEVVGGEHVVAVTRHRGPVVSSAQ